MVYHNALRTSNILKIYFKNRNTLSFARHMSDERNELIIEHVEDKAIIKINRPNKLNVFNMSMVSKLFTTLKTFETEKTAVLLKGNGDKAFCAGGDLACIFQIGKRNIAETFFRNNYILIEKIGNLSIPYIAFIDGIVMGGGLGISNFGRNAIATERTIFAVPELRVGLIPDGGASHILSRLPGKLGLYLAFTGLHLKGSDVLKAGVATHYVHSKNLPDLENQLLACTNSNEMNERIFKFSSSVDSEFSLKPYLKQIEYCFCAPTVEGIIQNLKDDHSQWAQNTLRSMSSMCPTSLKITKLLLERAKDLSLCECLNMEYRVVYHISHQTDLYEGVWALFMEKDLKPKWNPRTLEEVSDEYVENYFTKLSKELEWKPID